MCCHDECARGAHAVNLVHGVDVSHDVYVAGCKLLLHGTSPASAVPSALHGTQAPHPPVPSASAAPPIPGDAAAAGEASAAAVPAVANAAATPSATVATAMPVVAPPSAPNPPHLPLLQPKMKGNSCTHSRRAHATIARHSHVHHSCCTVPPEPLMVDTIISFLHCVASPFHSVATT